MNLRSCTLGNSRHQRGAVALIILFIAAIAAISIVVRQLSSVSLQSEWAFSQGGALIDAKGALLGYTLTNADDPDGAGPAPPVYWGVLPQPDVGKRDAAHTEGMAPLNFGEDTSQGILLIGNKDYALLLGRLPWRSLGIKPLRDHGGECLWYGVSAAFKTSNSAQPNYVSTFNWDTLGDFETGLSDNLHLSRAVAVVFSPGSATDLQTRTKSANSQIKVDECGGNYMLGQYVESLTLPIPGSLAETDAYQSVFYIPAAQPSPATIPAPSVLITAPGTSSKTTDRWVAISADELFGQLAAVGEPAATLNALIPKLQTCLNDKGIPSADLPATVAGTQRRFSGPIQGGLDCPGLSTKEKSEFSRWRDNFWLLACDNPVSGCVSVKETPTSPATPCDGLLVFSGRRTTRTDAVGEQRRYTTATANHKTVPENYFEITPNGAGALDVFTRSNITTLIARPALSLAPEELANDVAVCLARANPSSPDPNNLVEVSPVVSGETLVRYDTVDDTLTLGNPALDSGAIGSAAVGCIWEVPSTPRLFGNGYRFYFKLRIDQVGDGFTFALVDAARNPEPAICGGTGSEGQFLGYAGTNTDSFGNQLTPPLEFPKIGIEVDTVRNTGTLTLSGRNDSTANHTAILYWGESDEWTAPYLNQHDDDNVHGAPANVQIAYRDPVASERKTITELKASLPLERTVHVRVDVERNYDPVTKTGQYRTRAWTRPEKWGSCSNTAIADQFDTCTGVLARTGGFLGGYTGTITASAQDSMPIGRACTISFSKDSSTGKGRIDFGIGNADAPPIFSTAGTANIDGDATDKVLFDSTSGQTIASIIATSSAGSVDSTLRIVGITPQSIVGEMVSGSGQMTLRCSAAMTTPARNAPPIAGMDNTTRDFSAITTTNPDMDELELIADPDTTEAFRSFRLGFTVAQSIRRQRVLITNMLADPR